VFQAGAVQSLDEVEPPQGVEDLAVELAVVVGVGLFDLAGSGLEVERRR